MKNNIRGEATKVKRAIDNMLPGVKTFCNTGSGPGLESG